MRWERVTMSFTYAESLCVDSIASNHSQFKVIAWTRQLRKGGKTRRKI